MSKRFPLQKKLYVSSNRCNITGQLGRGKVFNNIDQEYRSVAVIGMGREGAAFNELEMIDEGMVSLEIFSSFLYCFALEA